VIVLNPTPINMKKVAIVVIFIILKKSISVKMEFMLFPFVFVVFNNELIQHFTNDTLLDPETLREYQK